MKELSTLQEIPTEEKIEGTLDREKITNLDSPLHELSSEDEVKEYIPLEKIIEEVSDAEKEIYDKANVEVAEVNDRECLVRTDIDNNVVDGRGNTNLERMSDGKPPLIDGKPVELHHIGQKNDAPLAELTQSEHRGPGNDGVLHDKTKESEIDRNEFKKEREDHWKARAEEIKAEGGEV